MTAARALGGTLKSCGSSARSTFRANYAVAPPVALQPGGAVELQDDDWLVRQQRGLDPATQHAQAQCDYRLAQLGRAGDIAPRQVEGDVHLEAAHRSLSPLL